MKRCIDKIIGPTIRLSILIMLFFAVCSANAASTNVLINPGFEDSNGWETHYCTFSYSTAQHHSGSQSGKASGRSSGTWQGLQQSILDKVVAGSTYSISAWLRLDNKSSDTVKISIQKNFINDPNTHYSTVATGTANSSGWTSLSGTYTIDANLTSLYLYFEGPATDVNFYVDDANVFGPPVVTDANVKADINASTRHQTLEGFGAAGAWYDGTLVTLGTNNSAIYNVLFRDLGLDIYRLRNAYDESGGSSYINNSATIISHAATSLGHPIKVLVSCWSAPSYLKTDGNTVGGTLAKDFNDPNNGSNGYVYQRFAKWWYDSIINFNSHGVTVDYASMQNEPDWLADWDTCKFTPTESSSYAGYNTAFAALCAKMATLTNHPKLLAPETAGFSQLSDYLNAISDKSMMYGYAHHLYNSNSGGSFTNPDGFLGDMTSFASSFSDKPRMQTEFSDTETSFTDAMNLAILMHNSLTAEEAAAYFHWDLFWGTSGTGLVSITNTTYTINPVYWAFKHYAAFTDPNWQRIDASTNSSSLRISAYISPDNNQISIVLINTSTDTNIALDFNSFGNFEISDGDVYRTSSTQNCVLLGDFNENAILTLPKNTITTVALTGTLLPTNCPEVQSYGYRMPGDLNGDCQVNYKDLYIMAEYWLQSTPITPAPPEHSPDIHTGSDNIVNMLDFADLADAWLSCNVPNQTGCIANW